MPAWAHSGNYCHKAKVNFLKYLGFQMRAKATGMLAGARTKPTTQNKAGARRSDVSGPSTKEIFFEMIEIHKGVTPEERAREKEGAILALPARWATGKSTLATFQNLLYFGLPLDDFDSYVQRVQAVDADAVLAAAKAYITVDLAQLLIVGDAKTVLPQIEELRKGRTLTGELVILDVEGVVKLGKSALRRRAVLCRCCAAQKVQGVQVGVGMPRILKLFVVCVASACTHAGAPGDAARDAATTAEVVESAKDTPADLASECTSSAQCGIKAGVCVDGRCVVNCISGTKFCNGKGLWVCNPLGNGWVEKTCDDANVCTADDCDAKALACSATATVCDDGNPCTADACDAILGCQHGKAAVLDGDKDGFTSKGCGGDDCDDTKKAVNPSAKEDCATIGVDDNCDGKTDEGCDVFTCEKDGDVCGGKGKCSGGHCFWTNSVGYKFTLVPGGNFWMGCNAEVDIYCSEQEKPQHEVELSPYWIGVYEVKVSIYQACIDAKVSGCTAPKLSSTLQIGNEMPIDHMQWPQGRAVCQWFGADLPTEAQWEKAARGGCALYPGKDCAKVMPKYPWGNKEPICGKQAQCGLNATALPKEVGSASKQGQSPYGAFDMAGNVQELTLDVYDYKFYNKASASQKDALNGNGANPNFHTCRGGDCWGNPDNMRASARANHNDIEDADYTGVRCVHAFQ